MTDAVRTVAALGREVETMRMFDIKTGAASKQWRCLVLGSLGFGMVQGTIMLMAALLFYWSSRRLADGVVSKNDWVQASPWLNLPILRRWQTYLLSSKRFSQLRSRVAGSSRMWETTAVPPGLSKLSKYDPLSRARFSELT